MQSPGHSVNAHLRQPSYVQAGHAWRQDVRRPSRRIRRRRLLANLIPWRSSAA